MDETPRENPWEKLKRVDEPTFYVATRYRWRWREEDAFWKASEPMERYLWDVAYPKLSSHRLGVVIGASTGRLAVPIGKRFTRLTIVDRSRAVAARLRDACQRAGVCAVEMLEDVSALGAEPADIICSVLHYPHIRDRAEISADIGMTSRCLRGIAFVHFDTTPRTRMQCLTDRLPMHPFAQDPGRRPVVVRHSADELRTLFTHHGLRVEREFNPDSARHVFALTPATVGARI